LIPIFFVARNQDEMPSKIELPTYQFGAASKQKKTPRRSKTKGRRSKRRTKKRSQKRGRK